MKKHNYLLYLILTILIIFLVYNALTDKIEKFTVYEDDSLVSIDTTRARPYNTRALYPIIKNIFPDKDIKFIDKSFDKLLVDTKLTIITDQLPAINSPYIFLSEEAYTNTMNKKHLHDFNAIFKLVPSEHPNIVFKQGYVYFPQFLTVGTEIINSSPFKRHFEYNYRPKLAVYIASYSPKHRNAMFKALYKLDPTVEGLGRANNTIKVKLPKVGEWHELSKLYQNYKFGFAMENTNEEGYITEKIMNVYRGGAIPIYWGSSTVKNIFNPDSFIYVNDFDSFDDCAKEIVAIANTPSRLEKMQKAPIFLDDNKFQYYYDTPSPQWVVDIANNIRTQMIDNK